MEIVLVSLVGFLLQYFLSKSSLTAKNEQGERRINFSINLSQVIRPFNSLRLVSYAELNLITSPIYWRQLKWVPG